VILLIGTKIKQVRNKRGYSIRALGKQTGLSSGFIGDIESGRCNPSIKNLQKLANALGCPVEFFLNNEVVENDQNELIKSSILDKAV
jgi:XRE family transcriptional regulator of biofilm formation